MNHTVLSTVVMMLTISIVSVSDASAELPRYAIKKVDVAPKIDGVLDEPCWKNAVAVGDFSFPWWTGGEREQTVAKMLWDEQNLYISYQCDDRKIWSEHTQRDSQVWLDDCVEVFTAPDPQHPNHYFNIEMNVGGAFLDEHHPDGPGKAITQPFDATGIRLATTVDGTLNDDSDTDKGWVLEVAIPFANFADFAAHTPPQNGDQWRLNLNRLGGQSNAQFSQWSAGKTPQPQFHAPESFGYVTFEP